MFTLFLFYSNLNTLYFIIINFNCKAIFCYSGQTNTINLYNDKFYGKINGVIFIKNSFLI